VDREWLNYPFLGAKVNCCVAAEARLLARSSLFLLATCAATAAFEAARRWDRADAQLEKARAFDPSLAEVEKEFDTAYRAYARARTYKLVGRKADSDAALAEFETTFAADWA
jgi:hypothetical protein